MRSFSIPVQQGRREESSAQDAADTAHEKGELEGGADDGEAAVGDAFAGVGAERRDEGGADGGAEDAGSTVW